MNEPVDRPDFEQWLETGLYVQIREDPADDDTGPGLWCIRKVCIKGHVNQLLANPDEYDPAVLGTYREMLIEGECDCGTPWDDDPPLA